MRTFAKGTVILAIFAFSSVSAEQKNPERVGPPSPAVVQKEAEQLAKLEKIVVDWEKQGARLKFLDIAFTRLDKSPLSLNVEEYHGRVHAKSPNLLSLHLSKVTKDSAGNGDLLKDFERIVCTGTEVLQYDYERHQIFRFPQPNDPRFRFIPLTEFFAPKASQLKDRYEIALVQKTDKVGLFIFTPKNVSDKQIFSKVCIQLNLSTYLLDRLLVIYPNRKDTQDYVFTAVQANQPPKDEYFQPQLITGWKVTQGRVLPWMWNKRP